jgi:hypothetical protein
LKKRKKEQKRYPLVNLMKQQNPKRTEVPGGFVRKAQRSLKWLPVSVWQQLVRRPVRSAGAHLIICLADHFEPSILPERKSTYAERGEQERRLERWCREYPKAVEGWPDADGRTFRHTYFYPAEQYDAGLLAQLVEHCKQGWGEIELHLHHGLDKPDTPENTRRQLVEFRDTLARHGCLSRMDGIGMPRYAFVHGNFALANSAQGLACGVDSEMQILADTGCYADLTLPSAPSPAQVAKVNALYECALPLDRRAPHNRGSDLVCGRPPQIFPLILQGPLLLTFAERKKGSLFPRPRIENGALTTINPPSLERLRLWRRAAITVRGRPNWLFIKLHCHGMDPRDDAAMLGHPARTFLRELAEDAQRGNEYKVHFVSAREMANIVLAACDGREGNPGDFRDYRLKKISNVWSEGVAPGLPAMAGIQES